MKKFTFTSDRRDDNFGGWSRNVQVEDGQTYRVTVSRGKPVRIPYKPRGKNRGFKWVGTVYRTTAGMTGYVWSDDVPGSIGVRGCLEEAGVLDVEVTR